ncbi:hypothetical protein TRVL_05119 [Trypanosoma vivax]|nr:hypothetical protein TRVL_05119 [Trypanosoma vivax]
MKKYSYNSNSTNSGGNSSCCSSGRKCREEKPRERWKRSASSSAETGQSGVVGGIGMARCEEKLTDANAPQCRLRISHTGMHANLVTVNSAHCLRLCGCPAYCSAMQKSVKVSPHAISLLKYE